MDRLILAKTHLCTCITLFCTFLSRRCTTTTWKCLISRFVGDGNTRQQLRFSFPELWCSPLEFNSKTFANIWWIKRDGISAITFEAARIHFVSDAFVAVAVVVAYFKLPCKWLPIPGDWLLVQDCAELTPPPLSPGMSNRLTSPSDFPP